MTDTSEARSADGEAQATRQSRLGRLMRCIPLIAPVLLWAVPCWVLLHAGQHWPLPVALGGTALFVLGLVAMPLTMARGHGRRQQDWAAIVGDTLLGASWVLFTWSVLLGVLLRLALTVAGVGEGQDRRGVGIEQGQRHEDSGFQPADRACVSRLARLRRGDGRWARRRGLH